MGWSQGAPQSHAMLQSSYRFTRRRREAVSEQEQKGGGQEGFALHKGIYLMCIGRVLHLMDAAATATSWLLRLTCPVRSQEQASGNA